MDEYSFPKFLKSVEDLSFLDMDEKARDRQRELERLLKKGRKKLADYDTAAHLLKGIVGFRFWLATGGKPNSLTDDEFLLLEPICQKLIKRGFPPFKPTWLDVFNRTRPKT